MNDIQFKDLTLEWLSIRKLYIKHSTYIKYENIIEHHLFKYYHDYLAKDINTQSLIHFFENKKNEKISSSMLNTMKSILFSIIEYGSENYDLKPINFKLIKIPSTHINRKVLSVEDRNKVIIYAKKGVNPLSISLLLALYGGLRLEEICALKWEHIDFDNELVYIKGTATRLKCKEKNKHKTEVIIQSPKSQSSYREVPLPFFVLEYIKSYTINPVNEHYLLSNSDKIYEPRRLEKNFCKFCNEYNINSTFHNLRHSYATDCVRQNIEIKTLSEILGHSNVSTTLNLYIHTSLEQKKKEISKIKTPDKFVD